MKRLVRYLRDERGANTAEFALVLPIVLVMVLGLIQLGMLLYTVGQLHWATESAARCASVMLDCRVGNASSGAVTNATVTTFASSQYNGLAPATFVYALTGTCNQPGNVGKLVTGSATYVFNIGFYYRSITMTSRACYP